MGKAKGPEVGAELSDREETRQSVPQRPKPDSFHDLFTAQLKLCPFKTGTSSDIPEEAGKLVVEPTLEQARRVALD